MADRLRARLREYTQGMEPTAWRPTKLNACGAFMKAGYIVPWVTGCSSLRGAEEDGGCEVSGPKGGKPPPPKMGMNGTDSPPPADGAGPPGGGAGPGGGGGPEGT